MARWIEKRVINPPPELQIGWDMLRYSALPNAGGVLDQPYKLMLLVNSALRFESVWRTWKNAQASGAGSFYKWSVANPEIVKLVTQIEREL